MARMPHTGAVVALIPVATDAARLAVAGGEPADELHVTLAHLGDDATAWQPEQRAQVTNATNHALSVAGGFPVAISARAFAHATLNADGGADGSLSPCAAYGIGDAKSISSLRDAVLAALANVRVQLPEQREPFIAHITAGYNQSAAELTYLGPVTFDRLRVAFAEDVTDIPLNAVPVRSAGEPSVDDSDIEHKAEDFEAGPSVAGLALLAADTGRVLMLQRALDDPDDPAAGTWEFPGGHLESGDATSLHGALREWSEEVGQPPPSGGLVVHTWTSPNGVYQGHALVIPREAALNLSAERVVDNPDDDYEQVAWWALDDAATNPALRTECRRTPWAALRRALDSTNKVDNTNGKGATMDYVEVKKKVASEAGERRYGLPIGTELGQARNATAAEAQRNARARDLYETLVNANPREYRKMLDGLSAADLKALSAIAYSFRSSNPKVVQARIAVANALKRQGLDVNNYGGLGKAPGKSKTTAPRSRTKLQPITLGDISDAEWDRLRAAGWKGDPTDHAERIYPPGTNASNFKSLNGDDVEIKARTTTKPWETRKAQRAGDTIGADASNEKGGGDEWPVRTIGDIAAGVKRAKKIKDADRLAEVMAHLRKGAKAIGGPAINMIPKEHRNEEKSAWGSMFTDSDAWLLAGIESKVMSPNPNAARLRNYWAHSAKGRAKWNPGVPGDFDRLRRHLRKYVPPHMLNGLTANIHKLATGQWPGKGRGHGKAASGVDDHEAKGMALVSPAELRGVDAWDDDDPNAIDLALDRYADMQGEVTAEDEFERALADEVDWALEMDGTPYPTDAVDDDEDDQGEGGPSPRRPAAVARASSNGPSRGVDALERLFAER